MRKYLLLIIALCYAVVANAQGTSEYTAILQHDNDASVYTGSTAFQQAYEAAVDGDVIVLSEGVFTPVTRIEKSLKIYGAGFERVAATNTAVTAFTGHVYVGKADAVLEGFHLEGVKVMGTLQFDYEMKDANIRKCYVTECIRFKKNIEKVGVKQCRIGDSILGETSVVATGLLIANCYINGNARTFSYDSFVHIDHCYILQYGRGDTAKTIITNTIIEDNHFSNESGIAPYSTARNCIVTNGAGGFPATASSFNCHWVDRAAIFADGENAEYSETRTFELKDPATYIGGDGTSIGPAGGEGWNKVPDKPSIANLTTTLSGTNINITYDAAVK